MRPKHALVAGCIIVMWLVVLFVGVFGADFRVESSAGDTVEVPVVWAVAFFAMIATAVVGWVGFREQGLPRLDR